MNVKGKKVLITGAGGGIGVEIVKLFDSMGAIIGLADINESNLLDLQKELKGESFIFAGHNLLDSTQVKKLAEEAEEKMGGVDVLVNNAGITKDALSIRMNDEDWDKVLNINLKSAFILSREIGGKMLRRKWGRIINMASVVALMGNAGQANYSASKGGLIAMTKTMAREFAPRGITVNAVAPGFIETEMTKVLPEDVKEKMKAAIPLGTFGLPQDVANAVFWLASEETGYITGQVINVNGGMYM